MNLPIETEDLGKRYGKVTAVKHLSLRVAEGEIYAFLGLNGAGKTTTIRMLLGMIKPSWGTAQVLQTRVRLGSRLDQGIWTPRGRGLQPVAGDERVPYLPRRHRAPVLGPDCRARRLVR